LAELCTALVDLANSRGGPDNITVVAARFEGDGLPDYQGAGGVGYQVYRLPDTATPTAERPISGEATPTDGVPPTPPQPQLPLNSTGSTGAGNRSLLVAVGLALLAALLFYAATR